MEMHGENIKYFNHSQNTNPTLKTLLMYKHGTKTFKVNPLGRFNNFTHQSTFPVSRLNSWLRGELAPGLCWLDVGLGPRPDENIIIIGLGFSACRLVRLR